MVETFACLISSNNKPIFLDVVDFYNLKNKSWYVNSLGYAVHSYRHEKKSKKIYMHREVLNKNYELIDHINQIRHDNRSLNLRKASYALNRWNSKKQRKDAVRYLPRFKKWSATLCCKSKVVHLGRFNSKEEAQVALDLGVKRHYEFY